MQILTPPTVRGMLRLPQAIEDLHERVVKLEARLPERGTSAASHIEAA